MIGIGELCTSSTTERSLCSNSPFIDAACIRPMSSTQSRIFFTAAWGLSVHDTTAARSMVKEIAHAPSTVHGIWRAFGLQPHRVETFKLSTDPLFVEKVRDIVGLYLSPPNGRSCCVSMRKTGFRRSTARSPVADVARRGGAAHARL
jgi:hypothetical protein